MKSAKMLWIFAMIAIVIIAMVPSKDSFWTDEARRPIITPSSQHCKRGTWTW
jgi:hypothetical protein